MTARGAEFQSSRSAGTADRVGCRRHHPAAEFDGGSNPRLNRFVAGELQNSELVILDGLGHDILNEAPDRVAGPLLEFLRRVARNSARNKSADCIQGEPVLAGWRSARGKAMLVRVLRWCPQ